MITSLREKDYKAKEEGDHETNDHKKLSKAAATPPAPSTSRQWSAFRNPRIVRVSRSFGGKDRHSKVCTIRGLRDRRIRLSVPTAIQVYDLQDRLGLSQPSKVIDWLLDATKDDIEKLPPLLLPQGFGQFHQPMVFSQESNSVLPPHPPSLAPFFDANSSFVKDARFHNPFGININDTGDDHDLHGGEVEEASLRAKSKEVVEGISGKGKCIKGINNYDQENNDGVGNYNGQVVSLSAQKLFPLGTHSSLPGLPNNPLLPSFNPYHHWDASNLSLSQFGSHGFLPQPDNSLAISNNTVPLLPSSSLALSSGSQLFFCPQPPTIPPSLFPSFPPYVASPLESESGREINLFQLLGSSSQHFLPNPRAPMKPFSLNANPDHDSTNS